MRSTDRIIEEARSLPVEERTIVVDSLLRSLNPPDSEIDKKWGQVAKRRLEELRTGRVQPVDGDEVFARIYARYATCNSASTLRRKRSLKPALRIMNNAILVLDSILPAKSTPQSKTPSPIHPCGPKLSPMSGGA